MSKRVIRKYANRRLYDSKESRHLTLDEVRQLVVDGEHIRVEDAKTGEDLTRGILLQIIVDREEAGQPLLSTALTRAALPCHARSPIRPLPLSMKHLTSRNMTRKRMPRYWSNWHNGVNASALWSDLSSSIRSTTTLRRSNGAATVYIWTSPMWDPISAANTSWHV